MFYRIKDTKKRMGLNKQTLTFSVVFLLELLSAVSSNWTAELLYLLSLNVNVHVQVHVFFVFFNCICMHEDGLLVWTMVSCLLYVLILYTLNLSMQMSRSGFSPAACPVIDINSSQRHTTTLKIVSFLY